MDIVIGTRLQPGDLESAIGRTIGITAILGSDSSIRRAFMYKDLVSEFTSIDLGEWAA